MSSLSQRPDNPVVGQSLPHESAALHVTGRALYTDDLTPRTKDVLHAWPVQAPHAHALVTALRPEPAYAVPGVVRVLTGQEVPGVNDAGIKDDEPLFPSEVCFFGHAVCWVLGETQEAARRGAAAVEVDYEPLPSILTLGEAIAAESFQGAQPTVQRGDVQAGLERSAYTFHGEFELAGQEHFYLETHASLAMVEDDGRTHVTLRSTFPTKEQRDKKVERFGAIEGGRQTLEHLHAYAARLADTTATDANGGHDLPDLIPGARMTAEGDFEVTMTPLESEEGAGATLARLRLEKRYTGGLEATASGWMMSAVTATEGSAGYVALERVTGRLWGRDGSFVLQHDGIMDSGARSLIVQVVPDSGTGGLTGLRGTLEIRIDAAGHHYRFEGELGETP